MRILMLGNSFTFYNNLPEMLAERTGAEVVAHTRGGARLAEHLNPNTKLGGMTQNALKEEQWDYVILQEMSNGPITSKEKFIKNVQLLSEQIREVGATPVLYATWAYQKGGKKLESFGMDYEEMYRQMDKSNHEAAAQARIRMADAGTRFYELAEKKDLYAEDGCHPSEKGSRIVAKLLADVIREDQMNPEEICEGMESGIIDDTLVSDPRLRILYLHQLLWKETDEEHPMSTRQIMEAMKKQHGIHMHRTTVPSDIALLRAAGVEIISQRHRAWEYYLADPIFSIPELKLLVDAVQSSRFVTLKKSRKLIEKLASLTSSHNADKLKRTVRITGRVKSENEKGDYIIDAINRAINTSRKISFYYYDLDGRKKKVLKNNGRPYTVSPFDLIWDGDYYYLTGWCDERDSVRTFRVDRIQKQPELLEEKVVKKPSTYDIRKYTTQVFRMYATEEAKEVSLLCDNSTMKFVVDKFGMRVPTKRQGKARFLAKVKVCTGPTFYRWVFGSGGKIRIVEPPEIAEEYRAMLQKALLAQDKEMPGW